MYRKRTGTVFAHKKARASLSVGGLTGYSNDGNNTKTDERRAMRGERWEESDERRAMGGER